MKLAADELVADGWLVEKAKKIRWQQQDFFGCWDILAVKHDKIRFIQVSASPLYDRGIAYKKKLIDFPRVGDKEYWWYDRGWKLTIL